MNYTILFNSHLDSVANNLTRAKKKIKINKENIKKKHIPPEIAENLIRAKSTLEFIVDLNNDFVSKGIQFDVKSQYLTNNRLIKIKKSIDELSKLI